MIQNQAYLMTRLVYWMKILFMNKCWNRIRLKVLMIQLSIPSWTRDKAQMKNSITGLVPAKALEIRHQTVKCLWLNRLISKALKWFKLEVRKEPEVNKPLEIFLVRSKREKSKIDFQSWYSKVLWISKQVNHLRIRTVVSWRVFKIWTLMFLNKIRKKES